MLTLRGAKKSDFKQIDKILEQYDLFFDIEHLESMVVTVDENDIVIGIGSLHKLLEATFLCDKKAKKSDRLQSLKIITEQSKKEIKSLGFDLVHAFSTSCQVTRTLIKRFGFERAKGDNLILKLEKKD